MKKIITLIIGILVVALSFATTKIDTQVINDIQNIEKKHGGKIGVYIINRNDWSNFAVNIYKFLVVGAILKQSMADNKLLNQKVKISKNQIVGYSPITRKYINQTMTVKQLCKASMQGDNTATNILIEKLGGLKNLNKFILSFADHTTKIANLEPKINHVSLITNENKTTPKIMARDINKLAFSNAILDIKHRLMFKNGL